MFTFSIGRLERTLYPMPRLTTYFLVIPLPIYRFYTWLLSVFAELCYTIPTQGIALMIERWQTSKLHAMLEVRRGVNLTGARQTGKSTLAGMVDLPKSRRYTFDDKLVRSIANTDPNGFVAHESSTF